MKLSFKDLVDVPELKRMVQVNYEASGIPNGIVDAVSGEIYAGAGWQRICTDFHRKYPESGRICIESDTAITGKIPRGETHACKCKHGLWDIGIPIHCAKTHIATLFLGQFRYEEEEMDQDFFIRQADRFGFPVADYLAALDEVPVFSKDKVAMILTYNQSFAGFMSTLATDRMRYHHELSHRKKAEARLQKAIIDDIRKRRQVEKALIEKEQHYQTIFEQSPDAVMLIDPETRKVLEFNDLSPLMLGYSRAEFVDLKISDYEAAENPEEVETHTSALLAKGGGEFETRLRSRDGSVKNVLVSCRVIEVKGKKVFHSIFRDITEQKHTKERFEKFFSMVPDILCISDINGYFRMINPAALEILGYTMAELLGRPFMDYVHPEDREKTLRVIKEKLEQGETVLNFQNRYICRDGSVKWLEWTSHPVPDRNMTYAVARDCTERKQIEKLMHLQRDLGTALAGFEELNDALPVCLDAALTIGDFDFGCVYGVDSLTGDIHLMAHRGLPPELEKIACHYDAGSSHARMVTSGKPVFEPYHYILNNLVMTPEEREHRMRMGLKSIAVVPVLHEGRSIASLNLVSKKRDHVPEFTRYSLEAIALQVAGALARIYGNQALKASQRNLQSLFQSMDDFLFILDSSGIIVGFNPVVEKRLGYQAAELTGKAFVSLHPPDRQQEAKAIIGKMMQGQVSHSNIPFFTREGKSIPVETRITLGPWDNREAVFCTSWDISERLEAERARRQSEDRLQAAIETIDEGFALFDAEDRLTLFNARFLEIYGKSAEAIVPGSCFEDILRNGIKKGQFADLEGREEEWAAERMHRHHSAVSSFEQKLSDGRWVKIAEKKMKDGSTVGFRVDITDIKRSEELAREALKEKETLLREIHHRVKNNMQVVSSLLSLQAHKIDDPKILASLTEAECRVHSMALVHEILYQSDNLSEINLQAYLETLADQLLHLYAPHGPQPDFQINAREVILGIEHAVPFGLIITELLTNALKYATPPGSGLEIRINAAHAADNRIRLTISDNGPGLPPAVDPGNTKTLGLRLVSELVTEQLEGDWYLDRQAGGTCWVINWPVIRQGAFM